MKLHSIIDDKKKAKVREAIAKDDPGMLWPKKKAGPEPTIDKEQKRQLSTEEQKKMNGQLCDAIRLHDPDAVKRAIERGADIGLKTWIPDHRDEEAGVLALATWQWRYEMERTQITSMNNLDKRRRQIAARNLTFNKCLEVIKTLIVNGADPNSTFQGRPILSHFKDYTLGDEICGLLKKHGAKE